MEVVLKYALSALVHAVQAYVSYPPPGLLEALSLAEDALEQAESGITTAAPEAAICAECEYFGQCEDDPQKPDYCPAPRG